MKGALGTNFLSNSFWQQGVNSYRIDKLYSKWLLFCRRYINYVLQGEEPKDDNKTGPVMGLILATLFAIWKIYLLPCWLLFLFGHISRDDLTVKFIKTVLRWELALLERAKAIHMLLIDINRHIIESTVLNKMSSEIAWLQFCLTVAFFTNDKNKYFQL